MTTQLALLLTLYVLLAIVWWRSRTIFNICKRRIAVIHYEAMALVDKSDFVAALERMEEYKTLSYPKMVFDLTKWKYEHFFPQK